MRDFMEIEVDIPRKNSRGQRNSSEEPPLFKIKGRVIKLSLGIVKSKMGVNLIANLNEVAQFIWAILRFSVLKIKSIFHLLYAAGRLLFLLVLKIKYEAVRKLIWGRGRLGRPASHISVLGLSLTVFVFGEFLSGTKIVQIRTPNYEFLPIGGDVLAATNVAVTRISSSPNTEPITYIVVEGDTLSSIGQKYSISVDAIRYANNLTDLNYLKIGQELTIPPIEGVVYKVQKGDSIESVAQKFAVASQAVVDFNYLDEPFELTVGQELIIPDAKIPEPRPKTLDERPAIPTYPSYDVDAYTNIPYTDSGFVGTGRFVWPTNARFISQYFSWYHPALDITKGGPIYAADSGTVIRAGWWPNGYGYAVQIDHGNGYTTTYAHLNRIDVSVGDSLDRGQVLGIMGSTGRSTGTHVHFVIQYYGQYINPLNFF